MFLLLAIDVFLARVFRLAFESEAVVDEMSDDFVTSETLRSQLLDVVAAEALIVVAI